MGKLSKTMVEHLRVLASAWEPRGAYPGLSLRTLNALHMRALVQPRYDAGSFVLPHINITWSITTAGRAALASLSPEKG